jgi:hypothetical protein
MAAFSDTAPSILVKVNRRFRGVYCLHHQEIKQEERFIQTYGLYCHLIFITQFAFSLFIILVILLNAVVQWLLKNRR